MITQIYAALLGSMFIALSINVIKRRREFRVGISDAGNLELHRRIRAHANLAEYAPIFIILLSYAEYSGLSEWSVHLLGLVFLTGRIMHAYSLLKAEQYEGYKLKSIPVWRIAGMICTLNCLILLVLIILIQCIMQYI